MRRPRLEVADIFHRHGAAWRRANAGHVSLGQLKVMSAIEHCRTAALGGHVERCEDCGHSRIAYNSCRNRHCPKCQGAAARIGWPPARPTCCRSATSTSSSPCRPRSPTIAYQNKAVVYDLLFRAAAETLLTIAADPKHLGARIGVTAVLHSWGSAMTHHPHVHMIVPGGGISLDGNALGALPARLLPAGAGALPPVPAALPGAARRRPRGGPAARSSASSPACVDREAFAAHLAPLRRKNWFVYAKPPFAGPEAVLAYLARYTHRVAISNSRLHRPRRARRDLPLQGLSPQRPGAVAHHDARRRRVHPALPAPRSAQGVPPHPPLRAARQRRLQGQYRACQGADRRARAGDRSAGGARQRGPSRRRRDRPSPAMPLLRRPHDHRRDLRARRAPRAPPSPDTGVRTAMP